MRNFNRLLASAAPIAIMAWIPGALAQQAASAADQVAGASVDTAAASGEAGAGEIVVTGTRIAGGGFASPVPLTVVQTDSLAAKAPGSIADGLNQLPMFQASINSTQERTLNSNRVRTGNYLNLRALGTQRVLVLQNGQRLAPTGNNGGTDASLIPQLLVDRVDIVTGGASAAYGSDAVSGVVNFVLNNKFTGVKSLAQTGLSSHGDYFNYRVGVAAGLSLADDRLHVIASAERSHNDGIKSKSARSPLLDGWTTTGAGTAADPFRFVSGTRYSNVTFGGLIVSGPLANQQFDTAGNLVPFTAGPGTGRAGLAIGGQGADFRGGSFIAQSTTNQLFGRAQYDITPDVNFFIQGSYNQNDNSDDPLYFGKLAGQATIFAGNAFLNLTPQQQATLGAAPSFNMSELFRDWGVQHTTQEAKAWSFATGLEAKLGGLTAYARYTFSRSAFDATVTDIDNERFYAALDAVRAPSGEIVCRANLANPSLYPGCVPLNIFGEGASSANAINYVVGLSQWGAVNKLHVAEVGISGPLVDLWAGPLSFALGGEYRYQSFDQTSNSAATPTFSGLRGVPTGSRRFNSQNVGTAGGVVKVKEVFGEISLPLLKDAPLARSLDINAAARYTDYSTSGGITSWKVGGTWDMVEGLRLRATRSRDIRAPSLAELFNSATFRSVPLSDPLTGAFGIFNEQGGGNPNLKPEKADTLTVGLVLRPTFLRGFQLSLDYYDIKINDAIAAPFGSTTIIQLCTASGGSSPLCSLVERPLGATNTSPANFPTRVFVTNANVAKFRTKGLDIELGYRTPLGGGNLTLRGLATRLFTFSQTTPTGTLNYTGTADYTDATLTAYGLPRWRGNLEANYNIGRLTVGVQERIIGGYDRSHIQFFADKSMPAVGYTDINLTYDMPVGGGKVQGFLTVNNLFNKIPPLFPISNTPVSAYPSLRSMYDVIGTQFTVGIKSNF